MTSRPPARPHLRGLLHLLAFVAAVALCPIVIASSDGARPVVALYTMATVGLFGVSAIYHRAKWRAPVREVFKRLDHSMIFVTIAATFHVAATAAIAAHHVAVAAIVLPGAATV